jgi:hypothetical protein
MDLYSAEQNSPPRLEATKKGSPVTGHAQADSPATVVAHSPAENQ